MKEKEKPKEKSIIEKFKEEVKMEKLEELKRLQEEDMRRSKRREKGKKGSKGIIEIKKPEEEKPFEGKITKMEEKPTE